MWKVRLGSQFSKIVPSQPISISTKKVDQKKFDKFGPELCGEKHRHIAKKCGKKNSPHLKLPHSPLPAKLSIILTRSFSQYITTNVVFFASVLTIKV